MANLTYAQIYATAFRNFVGDRASVENFASECPAGPILELGAGCGRTLGFIKDRKHLLLESDKDMLEILAEKVKGKQNMEVLKGQCPQIPGLDESVAGVFAAFGTFGELSPICTTLQEVHRVLVPNGYLYFTVLNPDRYTSPPLGVRRTKELGITDFTLACGTYAASSYGPGEFHTIGWVRDAEQTQSFIVRQYFPTLEQWLTLFNECGFVPVSGEKAYVAQSVFEFTLKKTDSKLSGTIPIQDIYDSVAKDYDQFIQNSNYSLPGWIQTHLENYKGLNPYIIDLACGNGLIGKLLHNLGIKPNRLYGYDISSEMVKQCKSSGLYSNATRFNLKYGLPGNSALSGDLITAFGLLEFLKDPTDILKDIRRVLTPGGILLCSFEATSNRQFKSEQKVVRKDMSISRYQYSEAAIRQLLAATKLEIAAIERKVGYISPTTNLPVDYFYVKAFRKEI